VQEFSVPASYAVPEGAAVIDAVFDFEKTDPELTVFYRLTGSQWRPVSAKQFAEQVRATAKGLVALGVEPGDRVALMSMTRYEWPLASHAIWAAGAIAVPIYETSSTDQVAWILEDSEAKALIIETDAHAEVVAPLIDGHPTLESVVQIDPGTHAKDGIEADMAARGAEIDDAVIAERSAALGSADPAILIYTSGTTGRPKGCMLTHLNLLAESAGAGKAFHTELRPGRKSLWFLPMAHVLAHAIAIAAFQHKVALGHFGDIPNLVPMFAEFQPDFLLSVPRVFEKVYNTARQTAHDGGKGKIFDFADRTAVEWSRAQDTGGPGLLLRLKRELCMKLVYSKLHAVLGNRCEVAISGGAPLGERLGHFFRGMGVTIYEGYGLTETTAALTVNTVDHIKIGTVGRPLEGNAVRIAEDGEICLRGDVVFDGYWKNQAATDEALIDGWFHTGDLGTLDAEGYLSITGRKKEIIVTAGGKNVAPAGLEDSLRAHPLISQAMVVGDQKPFIGVLVTIDPEAFPAWKERNGKPADAEVAELIADADLVAEIDEAVKQANGKVSHAEAIKKFRILPVDFTEEGGEITPTLKLKRNVVLDTYADEIEALYSR